MNKFYPPQEVLAFMFVGFHTRIHVGDVIPVKVKSAQRRVNSQDTSLLISEAPASSDGFCEWP